MTLLYSVRKGKKKAPAERTVSLVQRSNKDFSLPPIPVSVCAPRWWIASHDENPRVSLKGLFRLAKSAIFSFSRFPLTMFYGIAGLSAAVFIVFAGFCLYHKVLTGLAVPGWTSVIMSASFFGSLNALGIGILGEYVVRIYDQVRDRPGYIVQRCTDDQAVDHHGRKMLDWLSNGVEPAVDPAKPAIDSPR